MDEQQLILVDENDQPVGNMEKMEVHRKGLLHRAFSVFIFNSKGEMLLQQRAAGKYHSGGLWSNTCCSHPSPGQNILEAASRRLKEEMGFSTRLEELFDFIYRAEFGELTEHEFDHVLAGEYEGEIHPDKNEVINFNYITMEEIASSLEKYPSQYTAWFKIVFPKIEAWWKKKYGSDRVK
jgi:isopentenyl-diphosphate delta-isomerase